MSGSSLTSLDAVPVAIWKVINTPQGDIKLDQFPRHDN